MHGAPSSAARDARDEAASIHAAAAVATALAAAAEEGLEDDGRGDALHHIAEVCPCPTMHTCVHTHVTYTHTGWRKLGAVTPLQRMLGVSCMPTICEET